MKTSAFICDCCEYLFNFKEVKGVLGNQGLFSIADEFKVVHPDKADVHFCTDCYHEKVTLPIDLQEKKHNAQAAAMKVNTSFDRDGKIAELSYLFKKSLFVPKNKGKK